MSYQDKPDLDELMHYGTKYHSGRYPWGSGGDPYQRSGDFLSRVEKMLSDKVVYVDENGKKWTGENAVAKTMGLSSTQYRIQKSMAINTRKSIEYERALGMKEKGYSNSKIAEELGYPNESSVRSLLNASSRAKREQAVVAADYLKEMVDKKGYVMIGAGDERELNISKEKLNQAISILEAEGYPNYGRGVPQVTNPGKQTNIKVLCPPGTQHKDVFAPDIYEKLHTVKEYDKILTEDGTKVRPAFARPESLDSKRVAIRYAEDGGTKMDGVIEIRRGVDDLSLGNSHYAQVRIMVDKTHYLKGMAIYSDDLPDGVDVRFNTNKTSDVPMCGPKDNTVLKTIKKDPDNPFGALLKERGGQSYYIDKDGKEKLSLINKTREEGDWDEWGKDLPSQFLSKQSRTLAKKQLDLKMADTQEEFAAICALDNPVVKRKLLQSFADDCDSSAVHLEAASLPRQRYQVIMPVPKMKDTEVYAPNYKDGEQVALIRYPHGGTFEIPILTVNNKQRDAKKFLGNALDAVGINSKVAERLSGADFDGDTVMVIPTNSKVKITSTKPLKDLEGFDPKLAYPKRPGMQVMKATGLEMGKISNLITDMTIKGAPESELAKAVKHSMVVIDAEKHELDYKRSERENDIAYLKKRYQAHDYDDKYGGAATLLSRAKAQASVTKRKGSPKIDPETGKQYWDEVDDPYYTVTKVNKKTGEVTTTTKKRTQKSTQMAETDDARTLISDYNTPMERLYADYANGMKDLANRSRKEMLNSGKIVYDKDAKAKYINEVRSLDNKLAIAEKNAPRERMAQALANAEVEAKKQSNPDMTKKEIKKAQGQAIVRARNKVGARRQNVEITDLEWEAIQAGAISDSKLSAILDHTDIDAVRNRAMPRENKALSAARINKIKNMQNSGYTTQEIAESMNVSASTIIKYLKEGGE
jgi:DNA-binding NarL/FixJ family response regulator